MLGHLDTKSIVDSMSSWKDSAMHLGEVETVREVGTAGRIHSAVHRSRDPVRSKETMGNDRATDLGEGGVKTVDLLAFLNESVVLCNAAKGQFIH